MPSFCQKWLTDLGPRIIPAAASSPKPGPHKCSISHSSGLGRLSSDLEKMLAQDRLKSGA
jgi:hypothetical protein